MVDVHHLAARIFLQLVTNFFVFLYCLQICSAYLVSVLFNVSGIYLGGDLTFIFWDIQC